MAERYELLKAMHKVVCAVNNEDAYMDWINLVPDEASDEDLMDIASNDEDMEDALHLFRWIIKRYCNEKTVAVDGCNAYL